MVPLEARAQDAVVHVDDALEARPKALPQPSRPLEGGSGRMFTEGETSREEVTRWDWVTRSRALLCGAQAARPLPYSLVDNPIPRAPQHRN